MKNTNMEFKADTIIELSFATVVAGKESQLFGEYFPGVMPIVTELGGQPLGSYTVINASSGLGEPKMGAFFQWPGIDEFNALHKEPRFLAIKHLRDNALQFFSNAHFFVVTKNTRVNFIEGQPYALIAQMDDKGYGVKLSAEFVPMVEMTPAAGMLKKDYSPIKIQLMHWDENCDKIMQQGRADVFKFILNMPE